MVASQRESPLKPKQDEKQASQQWVAEIVHERNLWHRLAFYFCTVSSAEHKKDAQQHCPTNRDRQFGGCDYRWRFAMRRCSGAFRVFCTRTQSVKSQQELCPNASEFESGIGFYDLAVHFKQWIDQKIDRSAFRFRIDHQIAPLGQLEPIGRIMTKIIISQLWVLPRLTDVYRHPLAVREKFGPAMITLDLALILVGWNGRADGKTRGYVDASRQSDEIRVEITTIAGANIARIDGVSAAPAITFLIIPHAANDVIVQRFRSLEVIGFSGCGFFGERLKRFVYRHQFFRPKIPRGICVSCRIGGFFPPHHLVSQLDCFATVLRLRINHANVIAVIAVLNLIPFHRDV